MSQQKIQSRCQRFCAPLVHKLYHFWKKRAPLLFWLELIAIRSAHGKSFYLTQFKLLLGLS